MRPAHEALRETLARSGVPGQRGVTAGTTTSLCKGKVGGKAVAHDRAADVRAEEGGKCVSMNCRAATTLRIGGARAVVQAFASPEVEAASGLAPSSCSALSAIGWASIRAC